MIKGMLLSACIFILLYLLYMELEPTIHEVVVGVDNTISIATEVERPTAVKWFKMLGLSALMLVVVRDAIAVFRIAVKRRQKPANPEDEFGPRLREERARRRGIVSTSQPEEHRWN